MTERRAADETLREAFQALGETSGGQCSEEDLERIWQAVAGELPAAERRELVDRMATDPACAEAWRVADALWHASQGEDATAAERHVRSWTPSWLAAAAAVVLLGVAIGLVPWLNRPPGDEFRDPGGYEVESLVPSDTASSRNVPASLDTRSAGLALPGASDDGGPASAGDRRGPDCTGARRRARSARRPFTGSAGAVAGRRCSSHWRARLVSDVRRTSEVRTVGSK